MLYFSVTDAVPIVSGYFSIGFKNKETQRLLVSKQCFIIGIRSENWASSEKDSGPTRSGFPAGEQFMPSAAVGEVQTRYGNDMTQ